MLELVDKKDLTESLEHRAVNPLISNDRAGSIPALGTDLMKDDKIDPSEKVCYNCKHLVWLVALGQGIRCTLPKEGTDERSYKLIHSRRHTCESFVPKHENKT